MSVLRQFSTFINDRKVVYWQIVCTDELHYQYKKWFSKNYGETTEVHDMTIRGDADAIFNLLTDAPAVFYLYTDLTKIWGCIINDPAIAAHFKLVWSK